MTQWNPFLSTQKHFHWVSLCRSRCTTCTSALNTQSKKRTSHSPSLVVKQFGQFRALAKHHRKHDICVQGCTLVDCRAITTERITNDICSLRRLGASSLCVRTRRPSAGRRRSCFVCILEHTIFVRRNSALMFEDESLTVIRGRGLAVCWRFECFVVRKDWGVQKRAITLIRIQSMLFGKADLA